MTRNPIVLLHTDNADPALEIVQAEHTDLTMLTCDSYAALPEMIEHHAPEVIYSVRFAGAPNFPKDAMLSSAALRWISVGGSGTDHLSGWDPARQTVTNAAGVAAGMMGEYVLGAMLHFSLDLAAFALAKSARMWTTGKVTPIEGKRILILGMGQTGQAIAERCYAMGMHVTGVRARPQAMANTHAVHGIDGLPDLWGKADTIAICVPLLNSTRGFVDQTAIRAMKPGAVVIDISRGGVTDQTALAEALLDGHLGGAALDVFETEPLPKASPLWALDNVILTPHCSSVYDGWDLKSVAMFSKNLTRYRQGKPLNNVVDPARGY